MLFGLSILQCKCLSHLASIRPLQGVTSLLRPCYQVLKWEGNAVWIIRAVFQPRVATTMMFGGFWGATVAALIISTEGWGDCARDVDFVCVPRGTLHEKVPPELVGLCTSSQRGRFLQSSLWTEGFAWDPWVGVVSFQRCKFYFVIRCYALRATTILSLWHQHLSLMKVRQTSRTEDMTLRENILENRQC